MVIFILALVVAAVAATALAFYLARLRATTGRLPLLWMLLAVALWSGGYALELLSPTLPTKVFWNKVQYLGIVTIAPAWFVFAHRYAGIGLWIRARTMLVLAAIPVLTLVLTWTTERHGLVWSQVELVERGTFAVLVFHFGLGFWAHAMYAYVLLAAGMVLIVVASLQSTGLYRWQAATLLLGILPVWAVNAHYLTRVENQPVLDFTPLAFGLTSAVYSWSLLRLSLLTLLPLAYHRVFEQLRDGVVVVDGENHIVDLNRAVEQLTDRPRATLLGLPLAQIIGTIAQDVQTYQAGAWVARELNLVAPQVHELHVCLLANGEAQSRGKVVLLRDITERKQSESALRESESLYRRAAEAAGAVPYEIDYATESYRSIGVGITDLTGYAPHEITPALLADLQDENRLLDRTQQMSKAEAVRRARSGAQAMWRMDSRIRRRDGDGRWITDSAVQIKDEAGQIVGAVGVLQDISERKRWENQLARQHEFEGALYQIGLDLLQRRDLDSLLQAIVENCALALDVPLGELMLLEDDELVVRASTANLAHLRGERVARGQARLSWQAYDTRRPVILDDYATWPYRRPTYQSVELHATADFPILLNERCIGILALGRTAPHNVFTPDDEHRGIMFSQLAALALDNTLLYAEAQRELAERRQSEEALLASEARYRSLVESTDAMIALLDGEGRFQYANERAASVLRTTPEAMVGKTMMELSDSSSVKGMLDQVRQVIQENRGTVREMLSKASTPGRWYRISAQPVHDAHGSPTAALVSVLDITESKQIELTLQRRLAMEQLVATISTRFARLSFTQAVVEVSHTLAQIGEFAGADRCYIFRLDEEGGTISCTHEWCAAGIRSHIADSQRVEIEEASWALERILRNEVVCLSKVDDLPADAIRMRRIIEAQAIQSLLCVPMVAERGPIGFMGFDSVRRAREWTEEEIALLRLAGEAIANAFERWRVEAEIQKLNQSLEHRVLERTLALRQAEARYRNLFEDAPVMYVTTRSEQGIPVVTQCNTLFLETLGYSRAEVVGRPLEDFYSQASQALLQTGGYARAMQGVFDAEERRLITRDGRVLETILHARPELDREGQVLGTRAMYVDITERKVAEDRLRLLSEQLRSLTQRETAVREDERGRIAREIHDELGQMLTALKMDVAWIGKRIPSGSPQVATKLTAMSDLVSATIRSVQRISSELRPSLLDTLGLVSAMEWQFQEFRVRTELACTLAIDVDDALILEAGLATALFRIFQEALTNIIRHAAASSVHVTLAQQDGQLQLTVRDDGVGIAPDKLRDPLSIGLIGMRERLHSWQGTVEFQSALPQGTLVCVTVPYHRSNEENSP